MKRYTGFFLIMIVLGQFQLACNKPIEQTDTQAMLDIQITHTMAGKTLELNKSVVNPFGEPITITNYQYYLSNFSLINAGGSLVSLPVEYFLVNEQSAGSKIISMQIPAGVYRGLRMVIGVDSIRNVSGVQSGALDPANGMFWSWNTGYIFAKLEGKSPLSAAPLQNVTYHIGGFKTAQSSLQSVIFNFPTTITIGEKERITMKIIGKVDAWFNGLNPLRITEDPYCMDPGALAQRISANYAQMFTLSSLTQ